MFNRKAIISLSRKLKNHSLIICTIDKGTVPQ